MAGSLVPERAVPGQYKEYGAVGVKVRWGGGSVEVRESAEAMLEWLFVGRMLCVGIV
jgi:hypothetical protein